MPKQSKIASSKPGKAAPIKERTGDYCCTRCPRTFKVQKNNFPAAQSPVYKENGGYLHVCRHCVEEMYQHYKETLGSEKAALRRICMKFDIYWSDKIYEIVNKRSTSHSRVLGYISKSNLQQFHGNTYDDTIDEEAQAEANIVCAGFGEDDVKEENVLVPDEVVEFWGSGLTPTFYMDLEQRYRHWCGDVPRDSAAVDVGERAVIKQICMLEVTINRNAANGKAIENSVNALNTLLGSANLRPAQKKKEENLDSAAESTPFGVWIRKIENTRPISEPEPEMKDVDGIIRYISVWFLGHLCKMLKIENTYSRLYEEEMEKLRVERPEYEGEDEESVLEDIFSRADTSNDDSGGGQEHGDVNG